MANIFKIKYRFDHAMRKKENDPHHAVNKGELKHKLLTEEDWANGVKFYPGCDNEGLILRYNKHGQLIPFYPDSEGRYIIPIDIDGTDWDAYWNKEYDKQLEDTFGEMKKSDEPEIDWDAHWDKIFEADTERMLKEMRDVEAYSKKISDPELIEKLRN